LCSEVARFAEMTRRPGLFVACGGRRSAPIEKSELQRNGSCPDCLPARDNRACVSSCASFRAAGHGRQSEEPNSPIAEKACAPGFGPDREPHVRCPQAESGQTRKKRAENREPTSVAGWTPPSFTLAPTHVGERAGVRGVLGTAHNLAGSPSPLVPLPLKGAREIPRAVTARAREMDGVDSVAGWTLSATTPKSDFSRPFPAR